MSGETNNAGSDSGAALNAASEGNALDQAREKLDHALNKLTMNATASKELMIAAKESVRDKSALGEKIARLEADNLALHQQVANLSMQDQSNADDSDALQQLKADHEALQQNYNLMKSQYVAAQDQLAAQQDSAAETAEVADQDQLNMVAERDSLNQENTALKEKIVQLEEDKKIMTEKLDSTISKLEVLLDA